MTIFYGEMIILPNYCSNFWQKYSHQYTDSKNGAI